LFEADMVRMNDSTLHEIDDLLVTEFGSMSVIAAVDE